MQVRRLDRQVRKSTRRLTRKPYILQDLQNSEAQNVQPYRNDLLIAMMALQLGHNKIARFADDLTEVDKKALNGALK